MNLVHFWILIIPNQQSDWREVFTNTCSTSPNIKCSPSSSLSVISQQWYSSQHSSSCVLQSQLLLSSSHSNSSPARKHSRAFSIRALVSCFSSLVSTCCSPLASSSTSSCLETLTSAMFSSQSASSSSTLDSTAAISMSPSGSQKIFFCLNSNV